MAGLLRKDFYAAKKYSRLVLTLALVFCALPKFEAMGNTYCILIPYLVPLNTILYDEHCRWDRYAAMLPYRVETLVGSKYLVSWLCTGLSLLVMLAGTVLKRAIAPGSLDLRGIMETGIMLLSIMMLTSTASIPMLYRFGTAKGRFATLLLLTAGIGVGLELIRLFSAERIPGFPVLLTAGIAAAAALMFLSFRLSVYFYRKRRDGVYD